MGGLKREAIGFTLIELLVVVSLIGVLATLVLANLNAARQRGRDSQRKADSRNIQTALRLYYNDFTQYPTNNTDGEILGCGATGTSVCTWGGSWSTSDNVYMSILPADPISTQSYVYTRIDADNYTLQACLENKSDEKGQTAGAWCPSAWMYQVQP